MLGNRSLFDYSLIVIIITMIIGVGCLFRTYYILQVSDPLKNIKVEVAQPVYVGSEEIVWVGSYDRDVKCTVVTFSLVLTNTRTADMIMLDKRHLTRTPKPNTGPGKNLPINFALATPNTIYPGTWNSLFRAKYFCTHGLFSVIKNVEDPVDGFKVLPAKKV